MTSDNGPWISYGNHAGVTKFREAKATAFDGGIRSSCIIRYPGHIEAGAKSERAFNSIDILPTFAALAGADLPTNEVDGVNLWDFISGDPEAENPHLYYPISTGKNFEGIISGDGRWKLHLPHQYRTLETPGADGMPGRYKYVQIDTSLFDMKADPFETTDVMELNPQVRDSLLKWAVYHRDKFFTE